MSNVGSTGTHVLIAGVSTRAMAESAAKAGFRVTSLDAFGDLDQHRDVRALSLPRDVGVPFTARAAAEVASSIDCDVVAYLSPFENYPALLEVLARGRRLLGNAPSVVRRARDPRVLAELNDAWSAVRANRWLLKPRASGGGHGLRWWSPGDVIPKGWHVQPFVEGTPSSIVFAAAGGRAAPLCLTRQLIGDEAFGARGFRYCGSLVIPRERSDRGIAAFPPEGPALLASAAARELDLVGLNCIDVIDHDGVAVPIEINPRWSASMELAEHTSGVSMFAIHAAACTTGDLPDSDRAWQNANLPVTGKAIIFARRDVVCGDTHAWLDDPTVRDVPHPNEHIPAGRPVCTVFATGDDADACYAALVSRARAVYEILDSWASVVA